MNSWLLLTIFAYLAFAITGVVDKIIIGHKLKSPLVVSFWVGLLGTFAVSLLLVGWLPVQQFQGFRFTLPDLGITLLLLISGVLLQLALLCSYTALARDEATRVVSVIGAVNPIVALILSYLTLGEALLPIHLLAFVLLLAGGISISLHRHQVIGPSFGLAALAGALFAQQTIFAKFAYARHDFISSFVLVALGGALYALFLALIRPEVKTEIRRLFKPMAGRPKPNPVRWIVGNAIIGGVGVLALNLALKLGPASLVNAARGVQYAGVFAIALALAPHSPKLLHEELSAQTVQQKLLAIGLIAAGIVILSWPTT